MQRLFWIALCLSLATGAVAGDKPVTVTRLDGEPVIRTVDAKGVCVLGNADFASYAITDFFWGAESYAYVFDVPAPTCGCASGFAVDGVHLLMKFDAEDVPATFNVNADFCDVTLDPGTGCLVPGAVISNSGHQSFTITEAGVYDIVALMDPSAQACSEFGHTYAVSFNFPAAFPAAMRPSAVTDDDPIGCTTFNQYGEGWFDVVYDYEFPGEIMLGAGIVCCDDPVADETTSWGDLKSSYR
jgi:hypothetical protein